MSARTAAWLVAGLAAAGSLASVASVVGVWRHEPTVAAGARLVDAGDYQAALRALLPAVAAAPRDPRAHYYLGLAYAGLGARTGAVAQLAEAVRLAPDDARSLAALGRAYRDAGATGEAVDAFRRAVARAPAEPAYRIDLAGLLLEAGRADEAAATLDGALGGTGASAALRLVLGRALCRAGHIAQMLEQYRVAAREAREPALAELAREDLREAASGRSQCAAGSRPGARANGGVASGEPRDAR